MHQNGKQKTAILYTRVSTDEQADKGYSLRDQHERLIKFCQLKGYRVLAHFQDDYSAKTFNRPEFNKLLLSLKSNPADLLLFVKWDRFSRNTSESYAMIDKLLKLGVTPEAVEQPIDISIPEQRLMLAFYLSAPEVENARRGLNTKAGMRRAIKEGRYVTTAPKGYKYEYSTGKPAIVPTGDAVFIRSIFEQVASGLYSAEQVYIRELRKGFKSGRSNFYNILRNPVYAGYVRLSRYKDEPEQLITGIHEPIISKDLFRQVQDVLDGRKRSAPKTSCFKDHLPLRGHLICPDCGRVLTGSRSRGRFNKHYYYYHCNSPCKIRFKVEDADEKFNRVLSSFKMPREWARLTYEIIKDSFAVDISEKEREVNKLDALIDQAQARIIQAQDMLFANRVDLNTYTSANERYTKEIADLELKKSQLETITSDTDSLIQYTLSLITDLPKYYSTASIDIKHLFIGSMFPEKLTFDGNQYRTARINRMLEVYAMKINKLQGLKIGRASISESSSCLAPQSGLLSKPYMDDMSLILRLREYIQVENLFREAA